MHLDVTQPSSNQNRMLWLVDFGVYRQHGYRWVRNPPVRPTHRWYHSAWTFGHV